jgi:hypothetical protein
MIGTQALQMQLLRLWFVDARRDDRAPEATSVLPRFRVAQRQKPTRKTCE